MPDKEQVAAEHILKLAKSEAIKVALVRYTITGALSVRSTRGFPSTGDSPFVVLAKPEEFYKLAGITAGNVIPWWPDMDEQTAQIIADRLNEMGR